MQASAHKLLLLLLSLSTTVLETTSLPVEFLEEEANTKIEDIADQSENDLLATADQSSDESEVTDFAPEEVKLMKKLDELTSKSVDIIGKMDHDYGIILDAGSTSTKAHLYSWKRKDNIAIVPDIFDENYKKFKPGISAFQDTSGIPGYMTSIFNILKSWVPESHIGSTHVYFMATAGLRLLPEDITDAILEEVRTVMRNTTINPFVFTDDHVRLLSGEEEGFLAWITVNYLRGFFSSESSVSESTGIIEVGGGSAQIAYTPEVPIYEDKLTAFIGGQTYDVYTHSYLSYGANMMTRKIREFLVRENRHALVLVNPCDLRGDINNVTVDDKTVEMTGVGNATECETILKYYLQQAPDYMCFPKPCTIGSVYGPPIDSSMTFIAMGAIYNTVKELKLLNKVDGEVIPNDMRNVTHWFCRKTLREAEEDFGIHPRWASSDCMNGLYIPMFMDKLGFESNTTSIETKKYIGNTKIVWSVGAILLEQENNYLRHRRD